MVADVTATPMHFQFSQNHTTTQLDAIALMSKNLLHFALVARIFWNFVFRFFAL